MLILSKTIKLIQDGWCQFSYALTLDDKPVSFISKDAKKFCIDGALRKIFRENNCTITEEFAFLDKIDMEIRKITVYFTSVVFNDNPKTTKDDVLDFLRNINILHPDW